MIARLPFLGFVLFLSIGILAGGFWAEDFVFRLDLVLAVSLLLSAISFWLYRVRKYRLFAVMLAIFLIVSGYFSIVFRNQILEKQVEQVNNVEYTAYEALVKTIAEKRKTSLRIELDVLSLRTDSGWVSVSTKALVNIPLKASNIPAPGDHIVVSGKLWEPKAPLNPDEFNYQKFLWNKGVTLTGFLPDRTFEIVRGDEDNWNPILWSVKVSQWADKQFRENIQDDRSYGLVKAMLLGRRDDLRSDQIDDYTTSGTVHILSVSGMHVAMIFLVISFLLGWMKRFRGGKFLYLFTVSSLLFFYSMVTGFPPSVQRATVMCVVLVMAEVFGKKHNSVNTLGVSAFLILLFDPMALYDVGFQLSYLAMLGIFLFYKPLENIWRPSNKLMLITWQITALSFAAQLATFPLSIYYFHQFPFYFWLVNPFVILFTNVLLPASMVLLFMSLFSFHFVQDCVNWVVQTSAFLTNFSASVPKSLPGFLVNNLYLDKVEIVFLYVILFSIWCMYDSRQYGWLKVVSLSVILFFIYAFSTSMQAYLAPSVVFHVVPKHTVITFKSGNTLYVSSDEEFVSDTDAYNFFIKNFAISQGALRTIFLNAQNSENIDGLYFGEQDRSKFLSFMGKTIYIGSKINSKHVFQYQVLTKTNYAKNTDLEVLGAPVILLGGDVRKKTSERWKEVILRNNQVFYDLQSNGALLLR